MNLSLCISTDELSTCLIWESFDFDMVKMCQLLDFVFLCRVRPRKLFAVVSPLGSLSTQPLMLKLLKETPPPTTREDQTLKIAKNLGCRNNRKKEIQISGQILWINCQIVECLHSRFAFAKPGPSERERPSQGDALQPSAQLYNTVHSGEKL